MQTIKYLICSILLLSCAHENVKEGPARVAGSNSCIPSAFEVSKSQLDSLYKVKNKPEVFDKVMGEIYKDKITDKCKSTMLSTFISKKIGEDVSEKMEPRYCIITSEFVEESNGHFKNKESKITCNNHVILEFVACYQEDSTPKKESISFFMDGKSKVYQHQTKIKLEPDEDFFDGYISSYSYKLKFPSDEQEEIVSVLRSSNAKK